MDGADKMSPLGFGEKYGLPLRVTTCIETRSERCLEENKIVRRMDFQRERMEDQETYFLV